MAECIGLDEAVINALAQNSDISNPPPVLRFGNPESRIVIASGNALPTGMILFDKDPALNFFANEGNYKETVTGKRPKQAVVISASGKKHAVEEVEFLKGAGKHIDTVLLTCDRNSPAAKLLPKDRVFETRSLPEPITYNTSTYLGMIFAKYRENAGKILAHIMKHVDPLLHKIGEHGSYYFILPPEFEHACGMCVTKFDELVGGKFAGRCYTSEQTKHAKTVVPSDDELFVSIGFRNRLFGSQVLDIPLFKDAGYAAVLAIAYYAIGKIQAQKPPFFKDNKDEYSEFQKRLFDEHGFFDDRFRRFNVD